MSHYYVMIFTFKVFFLPSLRKRRPPFNECNSLDWHNSHEDGFFQSPFEANEMFCFYVTNLLFTNHKQPLKCVWQNSYLDLSSNTSYIIWQGFHLQSYRLEELIKKLLTKWNLSLAILIHSTIYLYLWWSIYLW